jgi:hypothetical protein
MNLQRLIFWKTPQAVNTEGVCASPVASDPVPSVPPQAPETTNNVVTLPVRSLLDVPAGLESPMAQAPEPASSPPSQPKGLMDALELKAFFADNHFGLGRHNGSNFRTQDALEQGKQAVVARFQNTLAELVEKRQAKLDRLQDKLLETKGFCEVTTSRLEQAIANLQREMALLRLQFDTAGEGKGGVLEALTRYQIGFGKGLREAIEFELLSN